MINFENLNFFIHVVENKSFTKAADFCEISKASISRHVKDLEEQLGARLLERTTRQIKLTEVGEYFYHKAKTIIHDVDLVEQEITAKQTDIKGKLTMYAPVMINDLCSNEIATFKKLYPEIILEMNSTSVSQELNVDTRFDILLYLGEPTNSSYIAKYMAKLPVGFYASPKYLKESSLDVSLENLPLHESIYSVLNQEAPQCWEINGQLINLKPKVVVDSPYLARSLALQHMGIAQLPEIAVIDEVKKGLLIPLYTQYPKVSIPIYGIYPSRRFIPQKTRITLDFIAERLTKVLSSLSTNKAS